MIEYIFHTQDETVLRSFFDHVKPYMIGTHDYWVETVRNDDMDLLGVLDWSGYIQLPKIPPKNMKDPEEIIRFQKGSTKEACLVTIYRVPIGFVVQFRVFRYADKDLAYEIIEKIIDKAKHRGYEPEAIFDESEEDSIPWEKIEDHYWDRLAVRLWWEGKSAEDISIEIGIRGYGQAKVRRVTNRICELRKQWGTEIVPLRRSPKKVKN